MLLASLVPVAGTVRLTIRRTRMSVMWSSDQVAATESPIGAIGIGIFTDISVVAGVASLPDPITEINDDLWFLFQGLHSKFSFISAVGFQEPSGSVYEIDSKAMRSLPEGRQAGVVVGNASASGARISMIMRQYFTVARG